MNANQGAVPCLLALFHWDRYLPQLEFCGFNDS